MRHLPIIIFMIALQTGNASAQLQDLGTCLLPEEPYPFKLQKSDPLYEIAREEHQVYLEGMEFYIRCIDSDRADALAQLTFSFRQFQQNFGKDAVFRYPAAIIPKE